MLRKVAVALALSVAPANSLAAVVAALLCGIEA
jgi:hypothetical protein